jgi:hypothetical protein
VTASQSLGSLVLLECWRSHLFNERIVDWITRLEDKPRVRTDVNRYLRVGKQRLHPPEQLQSELRCERGGGLSIDIYALGNIGVFRGEKEVEDFNLISTDIDPQRIVSF